MIVSPLDPVALLALGVVLAYAYRRVLVRHNEDWFIVSFVTVVGAFWLDLIVAGLSGVDPWLVLPAVRTGSPALAVLYPLAYPFWFLLGGETVFLLLGRRPERGGVLWVYRIEDRTEEFDPAWES